MFVIHLSQMRFEFTLDPASASRYALTAENRHISLFSMREINVLRAKSRSSCSIAAAMAQRNSRQPWIHPLKRLRDFCWEPSLPSPILTPLKAASSNQVQQRVHQLRKG
jgi:hypothetical protein